MTIGTSFSLRFARCYGDAAVQRPYDLLEFFMKRCGLRIKSTAIPCKIDRARVVPSDHTGPCVQCGRVVYDAADLDREKLLGIIRMYERYLPTTLYRNRDGTVQTTHCPALRKKKGFRQVIWGVLALAIGLSVPGIINWLMADCRDS